jgi:hypothetical protein
MTLGEYDVVEEIMIGEDKFTVLEIAAPKQPATLC